MNILKDLPELIKNDIVSEETAQKIRDYYKGKEGKAANKLLISFGILGSLLIGLGIILILAHNWDEFSRGAKTTFAFIPLVIGQIFVVYVYLQQRENAAWREASSIFLFCAVGSSISLISQIYNIPGNIASFTLTWMLLSLPLVYILRSSFISLSFIIGITYYHAHYNTWNYNEASNYWYFLLILLIIPHYIHLLQESVSKNFIALHHWVLSVSFAYALSACARINEPIMLLAYIFLFFIYLLIGNHRYFQDKKTIVNAYKIIAILSSMCMLFAFSFKDSWQLIYKHHFKFAGLSSYTELICTVALAILSALVFIYLIQKKKWLYTNIYEYLFLIFIPLFFLGIYSSSAVILTNILLLLIGVLAIIYGNKRNHLGIINYGLSVIAILIICRFFDSNIPFVLRGVLFVLVGIGFLVSNILIIKKRKANE